MIERLILQNHQSPGDVLMLSAALRDLHSARPEVFATDVRTPCPGIWENNPHITPLQENSPGIVSGGKYDFTIKWWDHRRYQEVVDHFREKILFVQVGEDGHYHSPLRGVLDLRGQTDLRQLVRLMYHAKGVLCPVTSHAPRRRSGNQARHAAKSAVRGRGRRKRRSPQSNRTDQ
jgi:ADP-heptose:LPS heptosyltransferase